MREFFRLIGIGAEFFKRNIQGFMADTGNFWVYLVSIVLHQALSIIFISVVYANVPEINGWTYYEVLFIIGFFSTVSGLFYSVFAWTLWFPNAYILNNGLDSILTLPAPPYFLVLFQEFGKSVMELLSVLLGITIMGYAWMHLEVPVTVANILKLVSAAGAGMLVLGGLFTAVTSISFWIRSQTSLVDPMMHFMEFAQYPVSIYNRSIRILLTFVIPYGFIGFYPAASVIRSQQYSMYYLYTLLWGAGMFALGYVTWNRGLRRYESSGS